MSRVVLLVGVGLGLGWAQTCQVRYTPPDYPELPTSPPSVHLVATPNPLVEEGSISLHAYTTAPSATAWVRVSWGGSGLATRDVGHGAPGYSPLLPQTYQGCPSVAVSTRPLTWEDNGAHRFRAEAYVYWREWWTDYSCFYQDPWGNVMQERVSTRGEYPGPPYYNCRYLTGYWRVESGVVSATETVRAYQSWERTLGYDGVYAAFGDRIRQDHRLATAAMQAYAYAKEIPEPVRGALAQAAQGYFYDCNWLGICQRADPAGEIKVLTDVPSILQGLLYTGRLCGGLIRFCFGAQNSRGADIGPKVEIKTFLMVKGWRHDYILLDRLIPRKYYDPSDREYPAVPEEERQQALQGCRAYRDTGEGRRCAALVEVPTGIVPVLKSLLMIDPMFQRGRQYP